MEWLRFFLILFNKIQEFLKLCVYGNVEGVWYIWICYDFFGLYWNIKIIFGDVVSVEQVFIL